ncbi:MAG: ABC transporter ATP-binding protein, partial [Calditrichaeota bacterium]|nr:ABC transporter ATP-binding protein [Calditrichota bacterium]
AADLVSITANHKLIYRVDPVGNYAYYTATPDPAAPNSPERVVFAVVAETCHRVMVMYGGKIQEMADIEPLFEEPLHPYTIGLLHSLPRPDLQTKKRLYNIPGTVPSIINLPPGCKFSNRCDQVMPVCSQSEPELREVKPGRMVRCHLFS